MTNHGPPSGDASVRILDIDGTAAAMWRCSDCGEMGRLTRALPESCPNCGGPRENLFYWAED